MSRTPVRSAAATVALALATGCAVSSGRGLHPQVAPIFIAGAGRPLKPRPLPRPDDRLRVEESTAFQKAIDVISHQVFATTAPVVLGLGLLIGAPTGVLQQLEAQSRDRPVVHRRASESHRRGAAAFVRTELFFGTAKPAGAVTPGEFKTFLDTVISPRFPEGLTVTKGAGQFTAEDGALIQEDSYVVVLLYPVEGQKASSARIDEIRREYMRQHQQESVLRADDPYLVWISF